MKMSAAINLVLEQAKLRAGVEEVPTSLRLKQVGGGHYTSKTIQPWDAMESWMSYEAFCGYMQGNVIKYVARYLDKNGLEDLDKADHYLTKLRAYIREQNT